ncbi:hypothetical protein, partial [Rothia sp. ZJ1223]|uniref:hypothetical protein n=1 Tax=Rothia sp. ZJ1223 TaxID=2811098 RepID=UPI0019598F46
MGSQFSYFSHPPQQATIQAYQKHFHTATRNNMFHITTTHEHIPATTTTGNHTKPSTHAPETPYKTLKTTARLGTSYSTAPRRLKQLYA